MQRALDRGLSSILLVPEIGLTPQTVGLLDQAFGQKVALLHSALTPEERSEQWRRIRAGRCADCGGYAVGDLCAGAESGIDPGGRGARPELQAGGDAALQRARCGRDAGQAGRGGGGAGVGDAFAGKLAELGAGQVRAHRDARAGDEPAAAGSGTDRHAAGVPGDGAGAAFFAGAGGADAAALERGEQALILLNRRGYSFAVICRACGEKLECQNCAISLTHHKPPAKMPGSRAQGSGWSATIAAIGGRFRRDARSATASIFIIWARGRSRAKSGWARFFRRRAIGRMDRDTVRGRYDLERLLARLHSGEINLLVGTQMIAKGHDIHGVTLVGVVGCDHSLSMPDFRAAERVFQLMTQVSGRAGRGELPGRVVVQTYYPDHYAILAASKHDYASFVERELKYRRWMHYPPFGVLANVLVQSAKLEEAAGWSAKLGKWFQKAAPEGVRVLGPCTAPIARIKGTYRFHMILKAGFAARR